MCEWTRACHQCQLNKVNQLTKTSFGSFVSTNRRFKHVHLDKDGPLPFCRGQKYILTMVDRFSRWVQAVPMHKIEAETVALAFSSGWISTFGCAVRITTDRGTQSESSLLNCFLKSHDIVRQRTSACNPKANGMIERLHHQFKVCLSLTHSNRLGRSPSDGVGNAFCLQGRYWICSVRVCLWRPPSTSGRFTRGPQVAG